MKLRTLTLALVALCLTVITNAHPIGKYIRHKNLATAEHIYSYNGHGHDKYSRVYSPHGYDKNFYHCSGLGHHVNCKHGSCHHFSNGHHISKHACKSNCHDHGVCKPHSGTSCGHHGAVRGCGSVKTCKTVVKCKTYCGHHHAPGTGCHPQDQGNCESKGDCCESEKKSCCESDKKSCDAEVSEETEDYGSDKDAKIRVRVKSED